MVMKILLPNEAQGIFLAVFERQAQQHMSLKKEEHAPQILYL
jgi:hypothetical protein